MRKSIVVGMIVFTCLLLLTQYMSYQRYLIRKEAEEQYVLRELQTVNDRLNSAIGYSLSAVKTLAFIVAEYGVPAQFDSVAQNILQSSPYIDALQLTHKGVITHTYPLKGNEEAIGFDILGDSASRDEANRAIETRSLFFAGPFELKQGGLGVVGRLPIFDENEFQGFAAVIIRLSTLLKAIGIDTTEQSAFYYQLSKTNTTTQEEEYFLSHVFDEDEGTYASIDVHNADWRVMVKAKNQQRLFFNITFSIVGLLFSFTGGVFAWYLVRQPEKLRRLVDKKTALVQDSQAQYRTTLERVSDGFISYDREWRYRYINAAAEEVLGLTLGELIGKNIWHEFPHLKNQPIYEAYHTAIAEQRYVFIESYLPNLEKWFENHLYPSTDGLSVFFRDITLQKIREEQIIQAYKEKETVLQRISDSVISVDNEWRYTFLNDAALKDHPGGRKGTLGKVMWDVHPELQGTIFEAKYQEAFTNSRTVTFESFYSPMEKWFAVKCYPSNDGLTIFYQDITESKEKDKLIEINEARLIEAQAVANVGSWETDLTTMQVMWSLQTYFIFELDPTTFKPTHSAFLDFVHPEDHEKVQQAFAESFEHADKSDVEHRIVTQSGHVKWIEERWRVFKNEKNEPYRAVGTCQDVTYRKKTEVQIQTEKFFSDSLINSLPGIFYLYDEEGVFSRWNKNFEEISGYSAEEIKRMHPLDFYDEDEKLLIKKNIDTVFSRGKEEVTAHFYTKDKEKKPYYFTGHKISINGNSYLIGVGVDIAERLKAEKELLAYTEEIKRLTAHLEEVREDERTRIAREVHDELGQQLTGLKMDASWLSKRIDTGQTAIHEKLSEMVSLMDHTIKTIRRISSDLRPGILDDLGLVAALEWQSEEFEKQYEIECVFTSEVEDVPIERSLATSVFRIYQEALTNVLRHAQATQVKSFFRQDATHMILTVCDNGQGFDYSEVKSKRTLGLIGMRERALMAGAKLTIESKKGTGTILRLKIPLTLMT